MDLDDSHVKDYLTHLAVDRKVAVATQNQAFNAILFVYRHALDKKIDNLHGAIRARQKRNLPVVMTKGEVLRLFDHLTGIGLLMAQLIYGGGLRLNECVKLRVKDIDFDQNEIIIRSGKWKRDRRTMLPGALKARLTQHLMNVRAIHKIDLEDGWGEAPLPDALDRKFPGASRDWRWQWPSPRGRTAVRDRSGRAVAVG